MPGVPKEAAPTREELGPPFLGCQRRSASGRAWTKLLLTKIVPVS
jgi:hypothetical protein